MKRILLPLAALCATALMAMPSEMQATADQGKKPLEQVPSMEKFQEVSDIVLDKCMACHSRNYDLPFYAKIPGIRQIIEQDYRDGLRAMDLNQELVGAAKDRPVGEVAVAEMEWVVLNNTMPPAKFTVVHWGSRLTTRTGKTFCTG